MMRIFSLTLIGLLLVVVAEAQPIQWEPTAGPPSARAPQFEIAPSGALFIAQAGRIARSTDEGATWQHVAELDCVEQLRQAEDGVIVETCDGWFRSVDEGRTWQLHEPLLLGYDDDPVRQLVKSETNGWFAVAGDSIYRSVDEGRSWDNATGGVFKEAGWQQEATRLLRMPDDSVYVAVSAEGDLGCMTTLHSWQPDSLAWHTFSVAMGDHGEPLWGCTQAFFFDDGDVYVGAASTSTAMHGGLYRWKDRDQWDEVYDGNLLAADVRGDTLFVGRPGGLAYSTDRGANWHPVGPGSFMAVSDITWGPSGHLYAVTSSYLGPVIDPHGAQLDVGVGVLRRDGDEWTRLDPGIASGEITSLVADADTVFALTGNGVWSTTLEDTLWETYDSTAWHYPMPVELGERLHRTPWAGLMVINWYDALLHLDRHGPREPWPEWGTWAPVSDQRVRTFSATGDSIVLVITVDGCLQRSADRGQTWVNDPNLPCAFAGIGGAADSLWILSGAGGVWRSVDLGMSWDSIGAVKSGTVTRPVLGVTGRLVFAMSGGALHRSDDGGSTWKTLSDAPLPEDRIEINGQGQLFLHNRDGVWGSTNRGDTWRRLDGSLPRDARVQALALSDDGRLYVGMARHGVWRSSAPVVLDRSAEPALPQDYRLAAPFPNPANRSVTLDYTLAHPARVTVRVYDVVGRHVAAIVEGHRPAGEHKARWAIDGVPAGIYFVQLATDDESYTRAVTVVR